MPTHLPPPRNWQDFEDLCCDLWRRLWSYPEAQKHGRSGQSQAGVDIFGRPEGGAEWVGVQCKHRGDRTVLSRTEIERDVELARTFKPQLCKLLIATTAPSDVAAQQVARDITERHRERGAFSVTIVSWDDILLHLLGYPDLVAKHYPDLAPAFQASLPAPATEEDALIEKWLQEVAADHQQLTPYFQRQPELDLLQRVYVELQLTAAIDRTGFSAPSELGAPTELREILDLAPADYPWVTRRWVVLGDPGAGKTTLLRHFTASLATDRTRSWVPVFESLPRLIRSKEFILVPIGRRMEQLGQSGEKLRASLERCGTKGRLLLLLDGLDEVPRERREEAEQILRGLAKLWPASPIVVTSRPIGYCSPGDAFQEVNLLPLDRARRRDFLARWLGRATGAPDEVRAVRALASLESPELRELAGNPLYLTLMALLFESGIEPERNRTRLYDQVFALLFEGRHHGPQREPLEAQETVRAVLRRLAYDMTAEGRDTEPVISLEKRLRNRKLDGLRATLERVVAWRQMRQFLDDLSQKTGILGPHDGPTADWRFWHRTFREALTAEQLAEDYRREREEHGLLARLWPKQNALLAGARRIKTEEDLSRWAEPFALLVGRVDSPDELVRALVEKNRPLGLRALATAQRLSDRTLDEILGLTDKWKERQEVYRRIPDLVGEPRRALSLLDRLRRRTRNGNDLYFLDQALLEVARRFPDNAQEATEIRSGFYNHIPPPAEDLFRWIDTPIDGRVPLWREIPAGRFRMGSPEGEIPRPSKKVRVRVGSVWREIPTGPSEQSLRWISVGESPWDDQRPSEKVKIMAPFHIGAVPVTNAQYAAFDPNHRSVLALKDVKAEEVKHHPVAGITWFEACSFCRWLANAFSWARDARLPAGEEWEYACRAGSQGRYWSGDDETDLATAGWYSGNSGLRTHRVGEKIANPWGLYDIHGNIWEWTSGLCGSPPGRDNWVVLDPGAVKALADESPGTGRVMRGGSSWDVAVAAGAAYWLIRSADFAGGYIGFRIVLPRPQGLDRRSSIIESVSQHGRAGRDARPVAPRRTP